MSVAVVILSILSAGALAGGLFAVVRQIRFVRAAYRISATVVSEWNFRSYGRNMRYYRVAFSLANGQRLELRSTVAASGGRPRLGDLVPVLVRESGGGVKAKIGHVTELWYVSFVLIFLGTVTASVLLVVSYGEFGPGGAAPQVRSAPRT
ncbi:hypothetical protein LNV09_05945 [Paucibacter sp. B2R-40]|uniref:hypothetical protein n=1 Tax=Paucibacter sp. B2R-40 TaxID=2893554 RepID=UPI0021E3DAE6|nr:hypothetical protein [Paucibacter sp. B2R-40]MCV2353703.1 hypothetical protein [Paucibacter sp. B2R-40]